MAARRRIPLRSRQESAGYSTEKAVCAGAHPIYLLFSSRSFTRSLTLLWPSRVHFHVDYSNIHAMYSDILALKKDFDGLAQDTDTIKGQEDHSTMKVTAYADQGVQLCTTLDRRGR